METQYPTFYRYDGYGNLKALEYKVVKETQCGYWIVPCKYAYDKPKFVLKVARKRYAYPTKELALESYIKRKKHQIAILESQLYLARASLEQAKAGLIEDKAEYLDNPEAVFVENVFEREWASSQLGG